MPLIMWQPRLGLGQKPLTGVCRSSLVVTCSLLSKTKRRQRGSVPTGPTNGSVATTPIREHTPGIGKSPMRRLLSSSTTPPSTPFDHFLRGAPFGPLHPRRVATDASRFSLAWGRPCWRRPNPPSSRRPSGQGGGQDAANRLGG